MHFQASSINEQHMRAAGLCVRFMGFPPQSDTCNIRAFHSRNAGATWKKKGVSLGADVVFLISQFALQLLKFDCGLCKQQRRALFTISNMFVK